MRSNPCTRDSRAPQRPPNQTQVVNGCTQHALQRVFVTPLHSMALFGSGIQVGTRGLAGGDRGPCPTMAMETRHPCSCTQPNRMRSMPTANELYDLAVELRDQGDKPGAVSKLEEAINLDTSFAIGHGMLAKLYADLAESDKAILHAKKVVELEPDDAFSYTALSVIYQRCGRIPEAEHAKAMAYQKQMGFE